VVSSKANTKKDLSYLRLKQEVTLKLPAKQQNYPVMYVSVTFKALYTAVRSVKFVCYTLLQT